MDIEEKLPLSRPHFDVYEIRRLGVGGENSGGSQQVGTETRGDERKAVGESTQK